MCTNPEDVLFSFAISIFFVLHTFLKDDFLGWRCLVMKYSVFHEIDNRLSL